MPGVIDAVSITVLDGVHVHDSAIKTFMRPRHRWYFILYQATILLCDTMTFYSMKQHPVASIASPTNDNAFVTPGPDVKA